MQNLVWRQFFVAKRQAPGGDGRVLPHRGSRPPQHEQTQKQTDFLSAPPPDHHRSRHIFLWLVAELGGGSSVS
jgi:hypothetical protein